MFLFKKFKDSSFYGSNYSCNIEGNQTLLNSILLNTYFIKLLMNMPRNLLGFWMGDLDEPTQPWLGKGLP